MFEIRGFLCLANGKIIEQDINRHIIALFITSSEVCIHFPLYKKVYSSHLSAGRLCGLSSGWVI